MAGPTDPWADQVEQLLRQLSTAEKVALLHQHQPPVARLGLGAFHTGTEALHGLAWLGTATVFPQALGLASCWDLELVRRVGAAVGAEVRGHHRRDPTRCGLNVWAPVVNPLRDPRWGRNEEGYAEDPWLTAATATAYAAGLRGDHPRFLRTAPTLKHFLGYNNETDRDTTSSNLPPRVLHEYELPAFREPLRRGAAVAVMASYNLVNGRPAHVTPLLSTLRRWSPEPLVVVSDAHAPSNLAGVQDYFPDHPSAHAAALRAGLDSFTDHDGDPRPTIAALTEALDRGLLSESDLDEPVRRLLRLRLRLGELAGDDDPYAATTDEVVDCPAHRRLARCAARRGIVLLTHEGLLPLDPRRHHRVAVIGPLADVVHRDWYSGTPPYTVTARDGLTRRLGPAAVRWCEGVDRVALRAAAGDPLCATADPAGAPVRTAAPDPATPETGHFDLVDWGGGSWVLRAAANGRCLRVDEDGSLVNDSTGPGGWVVRETFRPVDRPGGEVTMRHLATGHYLRVAPDGVVRADAASPEAATGFTVELVDSGADTASRLAAEADVAVVVLGNHPMVNGRETEDRADLSLPAAQETLLKAVHTANPATVLVVCSSYPYALGWADENLPAVLWSAHGGQEYGDALAEVLLGEADPAGRLTQTWYRSAADLPDLLDYDIIGSDATYLYYRGAPLYPFGHGHSYTTFAYQRLRLSVDRVAADAEVTVSVDVANTGDRPGEEVVQLYTRQLRSRVKQPLRRLRGFTRVRLEPGTRTTVTLPLNVADLAFWDVTTGRYVIETARHRVLVGRSATDIRVSATLCVDGERVGPRPPRLRAADYDDAYGMVLCDESRMDGDAVRATEPAAWLEFRDVDLSRPPTLVRLWAARPEPGPAGVTLRAGDPLTGAPLARATVAATGDRYAFTEVTAPLTDAPDGPVDLYLTFDRPGTIVAELRLEPA